MLLKENLYGKIIGRNCADGSKKIEFISKEESAILESVFITSVINAHKRSDVKMVDIPSPFIFKKLKMKNTKSQ